MLHHVMNFGVVETQFYDNLLYTIFGHLVLRAVHKQFSQLVSSGVSNALKITMFELYFGHLSIGLLNGQQ